MSKDNIQVGIMEKLTDWKKLWAELTRIQNNAFNRKEKDTEDDFWEKKAVQFDKMVEKRWEKPDTSREFLLDKIKNHPGATLVDVGAGTGKWAVLAAQHAERVTALEPSRAMQSVLEKKMAAQKINNIDIVTGSWPDYDIAPHDFVLASHSMYGVPDFERFVTKMNETARKGCFLLMRAPFAGSAMAIAAEKILGQPYDSPNFQIAYNILLGMDIYPDVVMEAGDMWPGWTNESFEKALEETKNRLGVGQTDEYDAFLKRLLAEHLEEKENGVQWPSGNRSALLYWETV